MIARVRIAPVERWCPFMLDCLTNAPEIASAQGTLIAIHADSMTDSDKCGGRAWMVAKEEAIKIREQFGVDSPSPSYYVCEHMLEMD